MLRRMGLPKKKWQELLRIQLFYVGWPNGWSVFNLAKEIYKDND